MPLMVPWYPVGKKPPAPPVLASVVIATICGTAARLSVRTQLRPQDAQERPGTRWPKASAQNAQNGCFQGLGRRGTHEKKIFASSGRHSQISIDIPDRSGDSASCVAQREK